MLTDSNSKLTYFLPKLTEKDLVERKNPDYLETLKYQKHTGFFRSLNILPAVNEDGEKINESDCEFSLQ